MTLTTKISTFIGAVAETPDEKFPEAAIASCCNGLSVLMMNADTQDKQDPYIKNLFEFSGADENKLNAMAELFNTYQPRFKKFIADHHAKLLEKIADENNTRAQLIKEHEQLNEKLSHLDTTLKTYELEKKEIENRILEIKKTRVEVEKIIADKRKSHFDKIDADFLQIVKSELPEEKFDLYQTAKAMYDFAQIMLAAQLIFSDEELKIEDEKGHVIEQDNFIDLLKLIGAPSAKSLENQVTMAFNFTESELAEFLNTAVFDKDKIAIELQYGHALYLSKTNNTFKLYDPDDKELLQTDSVTELAAKLKTVEKEYARARGFGPVMTCNFTESELAEFLAEILKAAASDVDKMPIVLQPGQTLYLSITNNTFKLYDPDNKELLQTDSVTELAAKFKAVEKEYTVARSLPYIFSIYRNKNDPIISNRPTPQDLIKKFLTKREEALGDSKINESAASGCNSLHLAINYAPAMVKILLEKKADPNIKDGFGYFPVGIALLYNKMDTVLELIKAKANLEAVNENGDTYLLDAFKNQNFSFAKLLLENKADPNKGNPNTPLFQAISQHDDDMVKALLNAKANIEMKGDGQTPPLIQAASLGNLSTVNILIEQKASIDALVKNFPDLIPIAVPKPILSSTARLMSIQGKGNDEDTALTASKEKTKLLEILDSDKIPHDEMHEYRENVMNMMKKFFAGNELDAIFKNVDGLIKDQVLKEVFKAIFNSEDKDNLAALCNANSDDTAFKKKGAEGFQEAFLQKMDQAKKGFDYPVDHEVGAITKEVLDALEKQLRNMPVITASNQPTEQVTKTYSPIEAEELAQRRRVKNF